jgi:hypothetical protein
VFGKKEKSFNRKTDFPSFRTKNAGNSKCFLIEEMSACTDFSGVSNLGEEWYESSSFLVQSVIQR